MKKLFHKFTWFLFGILSISVGLYPMLYFIIDQHFGLLSSKSQALLNNLTWNYAFYGHILLGGIALLIGWTQFSSSLRRKNTARHKKIGKLYILAVLISGLCGLYIAQFATGGLSNSIGFSLSALIWISTTLLAYKAIRDRKVQRHQAYMIYSYAICFSAVSLRIWLPLLIAITGEFITAYRIAGWLSWVPNLVVAYFIIRRERKKLRG